MSKKLLFSVTAKDCRWDYFRGSGSGGQKKNKTDNCARCTHTASGAVGKSEEGRSKDQNRKKAFERMAGTKEFKAWHRAEVARRTGQAAAIEDKVKDAMKESNIKTEVKSEDGKWISMNKRDCEEEGFECEFCEDCGECVHCEQCFCDDGEN